VIQVLLLPDYKYQAVSRGFVENPVFENLGLDPAAKFLNEMIYSVKVFEVKKKINEGGGCSNEQR
jgi:hypothetical protein